MYRDFQNILENQLFLGSFQTGTHFPHAEVHVTGAGSPSLVNIVLKQMKYQGILEALIFSQ